MASCKCGIFSVFDFTGEQVVSRLYWGLVAQNHRGHHSHGFATFDGTVHEYRSLGLVPSFTRFLSEGLEGKLRGNRGIGHVRYATSGGLSEERLVAESQPYHVDGRIWVAYNGNLVNARSLCKEVGASCEPEAIAKKLLSRSDIVSAAEEFMQSAEGSYSLVCLTKEGELLAFRDPLGIKPMCLGYENGAYVVSSESVGLDINGIPYRSEFVPGELVCWRDEGMERIKLVNSTRRALCAFEFAYIARPDSMLDNKPVYKVREEFGRNLAREHSEIVRKVDVIVSIPETGDDAGYGFHLETGIYWERAVRRHRFVTDRAFISSAEKREIILSKKINILSEVKGKRVAVIDDSLVRGDTSRKIVQKVKEMGAREVYLFLTFPKIIAPCFYGVDMATFGELAAARYTEEEIARMIGAEKVCYQSIEGFVKATGMRKEDLCLGCLTCQYPTPLAQKMADLARERFLAGEREAGRIYETLSF